MISQFYVLSSRGDTIINRDFRGDIVKGTAEIFFRKVKHWSGDPPPLFVLDGITFLFLRRNGLYFVATTQQNVSPAYCLELLQHITKIFKDFCGVLSEEAIRRNFVLIYEIIDEVVDCGYPQHASTERLKQCIRNEAVLVELVPSGELSLPRAVSQLAASAVPTRLGQSVAQKTIPSSASHRPVGAVQQDSLKAGPLATTSSAVSSVLALTRTTLGVKPGLYASPARNTNEIFVDILERLTVVMNSVGTVLNSCIDGRIQMKSYLAGHPVLRVALNEDIVIGHDSVNDNHALQRGRDRFSQDALAAPRIDDCNFHECVDLRDFYTSQVLEIQPPEGEFVVMNYRVTDDFRLPFLIKPTLEQLGPSRLDLLIELRAAIPSHHYGGNLLLTCPMPRSALSVTTQTLPRVFPQSSEYIEQDNKVAWSIKKLQGGGEASLRCRISLSQPLPSNVSHNHVLTFLRKEIGPITLMFEIPMYNISNVQVRYLRIFDSVTGPGTHTASPMDNPFRWVRYVTQSNSYVCRL